MNDTPLPQLRDQLVTGIPHYERRRQRRRTIGGSMLALGALVCGFAWAGWRGGDERVTVAGPTQTTTSAPTTVTSAPLPTEPGVVTAVEPPEEQPQTGFPIETPEGVFLHARPMVPNEQKQLEIGLEFIGHLRNLELEEAAALWSGYPDALVEDPDERMKRKFAEIRALSADLSWLRTTPLDVYLNGAAPALGSEVPTITVASYSTDNSLGLIVAGDEVQRIERPQFRSGPEIVARGSTVEVDDVPIEGGVRAFINNREVSDAVTVSDDLTSTSVQLPEDVDGVFALTMIFSTPELPAVSTRILRLESVQWGCPATSTADPPDEEFFAIVSSPERQTTGDTTLEFVSVDRVEMISDPSDDQGFFDNEETGLEQLRLAEGAEVLGVSLDSGNLALVPVNDLITHMDSSPRQEIYRVQTNDDRTIRQLCEVYLP